MESIKLTPFDHSNAELILAWRNSDRVRSNMIDNSVITLEQHHSFLEHLETDSSKAYFVVEIDGEPVGAIYFTDVGSECITWGCYIGVEKVIPGLFVLLIMTAINFSFSHKSTKTLKSEVVEHNTNPIKVNAFLGIPVVDKVTKNTSDLNEKVFLVYLIQSNSIDAILDKASRLLTKSMKNLLTNLKIG